MGAPVGHPEFARGQLEKVSEEQQIGRPVCVAVVGASCKCTSKLFAESHAPRGCGGLREETRDCGCVCALDVVEVEAMSSAELSCGGFLVKGEVARLVGRSDEDMMNVSSNARVHKQTKASSSFIMDEVATYNERGDIRVVRHRRVLNVANSFSRDLRGELANLTFDGLEDSVVGGITVEEDVKLKSDVIDRN